MFYNVQVGKLDLSVVKHHGPHLELEMHSINGRGEKQGNRCYSFTQRKSIPSNSSSVLISRKPLLVASVLNDMEIKFQNNANRWS